jgi:hypothetical protein
MRRFDTALAVLSAAWLAGCATSAIEMAPDRPDRPWTPATTESGEIIPAVDGLLAATARRLCCSQSFRPSPAFAAADWTRRSSLPELIRYREANNPVTTRIAWNEGAQRSCSADQVAEAPTCRRSRKALYSPV